MKKIYSLAMLLAAGTFAFTSCSDDNDSNPTLVQPTSFTVNEPAVGSGLVDLNASSGIELTWSQPQFTNFGAPVVPSYTVQVSTTGTFNQAFDENIEDNTGADYMVMPETYNTGIATIDAAALDKALVQLTGWTAESVPATQQLSFRVKAAVQDAGFKNYGEILSNVVTVNTIPYFIELSNAAPEIWYLTGGCIADGSWSNSPDAVGTGMVPMFVKQGYEYDKKTGKGELEYAAFFPEGAIFKIIAPEGLSNWNYGICGGNEKGGQVYRDGGDDPGNISITEAGYYKFTLNTATHDMVWEKLDAHPVYTQIAMPGDYQGWDVNANLMTALTTASETHDWVADVTFASDPSDGGGVKFAANGAWDVNWGGDTFPYGYGVGNGSNIWYTAGSFKVFFNDILGSYMFIEK